MPWTRSEHAGTGRGAVRPGTRLAVGLGAGLAVWFAGLAGGCAAEEGERARPSSARVDTAAAGQRALARGEWGDLDAAVRFAASRHQMAVVSITDEGSDRREYELQTIREEDVIVVITTRGRPAADPRDSVDVRIWAAIGRFGDPEREQALVTTIRDRLQDLVGVDYRRGR